MKRHSHHKYNRPIELLQIEGEKMQKKVKNAYIWTCEMDRVTKQQRSSNMKAVKPSGTKPEVALCKALFAAGVRYRKNVNDVYGRPDICLKKYRLAIFVDGGFWHGRDWEVKKQEIKSNRKFWLDKIERNRKRDKEVNQALKQTGWTVLRFWAEDVLKDPISPATEIASKIYDTKHSKNKR